MIWLPRGGVTARSRGEEQKHAVTVSIFEGPAIFSSHSRVMPHAQPGFRQREVRSYEDEIQLAHHPDDVIGG